MNFLVRKKTRLKKEQELLQKPSTGNWWTQLWCRHTIDGKLLRTGFVTASDELAFYFWKEPAQVIECPKCGKHVSWSKRRDTGRWQVTN